MSDDPTLPAPPIPREEAATSSAAPESVVHPASPLSPVRPGAVLRALAAARAPALPDLRKGAVPPADRLTIVREQDRVTRIVARCECGRKLEIHCDYAAGAPPAPGDES